MGFVPGLGEGADLLNGAIHLFRGNKLDAAISFGSMIPGGDALKLGKYGKKGASFLGGHANKVGDGIKAIQTKADSWQLPVVSSNCFVAGTQVVIATVDESAPVVVVPLPEERLIESAPEDNSSTAAAFVGLGVAIALTRHNLKTGSHRRRFHSRKPVASENPRLRESPHEDS